MKGKHVYSLSITVYKPHIIQNTVLSYLNPKSLEDLEFLTLHIEEIKFKGK